MGIINASVIAAVCIFFGINVIVEKEWCLWSYSPYCFTFNGYSNVVGALSMLFGVAVFLSELRRRKKLKEQEKQNSRDDTGDNPEEH